MKITFEYTLGRKSEAGNRHFGLLHFCYGKDGFLFNILGLSIIVNY